MGKFCRYCGSEITDGVKFCPNCGKETGKSSEAKRVSIQPKSTLASGGNTTRSTATKKEKSGISILLVAVMVVELAVVAFWRPGFLVPKTETKPAMVAPQTNSNTQPSSSIANETEEPSLVDELLTLSDEEKALLEENPIEATPETSPGNPRFITVSFSDEEYANAYTLSAPVSKENPTADFPEFDIHVNLKSWNLQNNEDTLIVKRLPDKTDETTGVQLYTYDYSLASGQHYFPTSVEVTAPIQGNAADFQGFVSFNQDTDSWEDVYCELKEDGQHFTAYMNHFSSGTQENLPGRMMAVADEANKVFNQDGKSIFIQLQKELNPKYENSSHYLYPVTVVSTVDFGNFIRYFKPTEVYDAEFLLSSGGKVPKDSAFTEGLGMFGTIGDVAGNAAAGAEMMKDISVTFRKIPSGGLSAIGEITTNMGYSILLLTMADQYYRGVENETIYKENKEGILGALISLGGTVCEICESQKYTKAIAKIAAGSADFFTIAGMILYVYTLVADMEKSAKDEKYPLGYPTSLADMAQKYYMAEHRNLPYGYDANLTMNWPSVPQDSEERNKYASALQNNPEKLLDSKKDNACWLTAFEILCETYENDPRGFAVASTAMYNNFVDAFWNEPTELQNEYFREGCKRYVQVRMYDKYGNTVNRIGEAVDFQPVNNTNDKMDSARAANEWADLQNLYISKVKELRGQHPEYFSDDVWEAIFLDWDKMPGTEQYYLSQGGKDVYHNATMKLLLDNTRSQVLEFMKEKYQEGVMAARAKVYDEVLPLYNARLTFYASDLSLSGDQKNASYANLLNETDGFTMEFSGDKTPKFYPCNSEAVQTAWHLDLKPAINIHPILLETTAYHYLMFGCPQDVTIQLTKNGVVKNTMPAKANWDNVKLVKDSNTGTIVSAMGALESDNPLDWESAWMTLDGSRNQSIQDTKVPIEYNDKKDKNETKLGGKLVYSSDDSVIFMGGWANAYQVIMQDAMSHATGSVEGNSFHISGSGSCGCVSTGDSGGGSGSFEITGTIDPSTGKGTCTWSGSISYSGSGSDSWTEGTNNDYMFRSSSSYSVKWDFSGPGAVKCSIKKVDGKEKIDEIHCSVYVDLHETGESNGSKYTKGPYNQEWIHVGKEEDDHRSIDETITAVPFGITMKYEGK